MRITVPILRISKSWLVADCLEAFEYNEKYQIFILDMKKRTVGVVTRIKYNVKLWQL